MGRGDCTHKRGDWIKERAFWLCCDCWQRLEKRPTVYGMVPSGGVQTESRQGIIWQAEIAKAESGLSLNDFLRTMSRRYMQRARGIHLDDAYDAAIAYISSLPDPFGDPAYEWTHEGAREMADDDMDYWECDGGGN
jgi:hypothetical protein